MEALTEDYRSARISDAERLMLAFVEKLTLTPWEMGPADVEGLREAGFDDRAILDINQVASYFAYVNRMADGLGVALEERFRES